MNKRSFCEKSADVNVHHPILPVFDARSKILILGSFPSVKSREIGFFYGHPQNRFWRVLSALFEEELPQSTEEKRALLLRHGIALWDVLASCQINGSSDASIKNAEANDLTPILKNASIEKIYTNGKTATALYRRYVLKKTGLDCIPLPSTSPANAAFTLEKLLDEWRVIL